MSQTIIKNQVPDQELMSSGHVACPGCGGSLAMRMVLKELGPKTVIALPACCWTIVAGPYPQSARIDTHVVPLDELHAASDRIGADVYKHLGAANVVKRYAPDGAAGPRQLRTQLAFWRKKLA